MVCDSRKGAIMTIHIARNHENIMILSMGKAFRIRAVADNTDDANAYCEKTQDVGAIACLDGLIFIADIYAGFKVRKES